jgi:hypothetical protein
VWQWQHNSSVVITQSHAQAGGKLKLTAITVLIPPAFPCCRHAAAPPLLPLCRYEVEAMYFDSHVRAEHYDKLVEALQEQLEPSFSTQLRLLAAEQLAGFDKDLTVALVEQPQCFSAAAERAAAAALQVFDSRAVEYVVAGTDLTGEAAY